MGKTRLEAFSDGVIAIIITIMVLELKAPHGSDWSSLLPVLPSLLAYALSFIYLGIYWNNHHHMLHLADRISGGILWANLHLLFWLSLVPFVTGWVAEDSHASVPAALYGVVFLLAAIAYTILERAIIAHQGPRSRLKAAVGDDRKGKASMGLYAAAVLLAFVHPWIADAIYVFVALIWLVPDRRIESLVQSALHGEHGA
jgi:uncharacterized membrane protein